jgi:hypothetical protein
MYRINTFTYSYMVSASFDNDRTPNSGKKKISSLTTIRFTMEAFSYLLNNCVDSDVRLRRNLQAAPTPPNSRRLSAWPKLSKAESDQYAETVCRWWRRQWGRDGRDRRPLAVACWMSWEPILFPFELINIILCSKAVRILTATDYYALKRVIHWGNS